ncbi:MAG: aminoglycoside phosphotransferase [Paenibacillus sp.]|jgi:aminoglycoside phosphotransferase (APT) family kinase protein|nr:aminoglycoside phosphotransferase [Paenibacillus sp.]
MNKEWIKQLVTNEFGAAPDTVERMTFGHCNKVYAVSCRNKQFIIRTNDDPAVLRGTAHNLKCLADLGLPVPEIVSIDLSKQLFPSAYIILPRIPGRDLRYELPGMTKLQMTKVAEQVTDFQKKAGKLPAGSGYGWVPIGERGPYSNWLEIIVRDIENHVHHLRHDFSESDIQRIYQMLELHKPYLLQIKANCFLDDITIKNVIVHKGELQGIIDFDWVCYGDSLYMISLTQTGIISDIGQTGALFYIEELCRLGGVDGQQRKVIDFYSLVHSLQFLGFLRKENQHEPAARIIDFIRKSIESISLS